MRYTTKLSVRPDGRCSVIWVPSLRSCQSCQTSAEVETGTIQEIRDKGASKGRRRNNSRKTEMSWKTGRQISWRMGAQEQEHGIRNCWFVTGTLPTVSRRGFKAMAENVAYAMDRLNRELNRYFEGKKFSRVSVWEYQKRGALHWHMSIGCDCIHAMNIEKFRVKIAKVWYRILLSIGEKEGTKMTRGSMGFDRNFEDLMGIDGGIHFLNAQVVKKSIVSYLSSYLSQSGSGKDRKQKQKLRRKFHPISTWGQWNRFATELMKKYTEEFVLGECDGRDEFWMESSFDKAIEHIQLAENTCIKRPRNRFVRGYYFIAEKSKRMWLEEMVGEFRFAFSWLEKKKEYSQGKGIEKARKDEMVCTLSVEDEMQLRLGLLEVRKQKREEERRVKESLKQIALECSWLGLFMLELMKEKEAEMLLNPYYVYEQIELNYEQRN